MSQPTRTKGISASSSRWPRRRRTSGCRPRLCGDGIGRRLGAVRRPGSDYRYYRRADLEPFRLEYRRAEEAAAARADSSLRHCERRHRGQRPRCATRNARRTARCASTSPTRNDPAIVQIPVGCGKTGIMATLPFGIAEGRVLVITPNLTIRKGVADALDITSRECFWTKTRVLSDFTAGPWTAVLDGPNANLHDCDREPLRRDATSSSSRARPIGGCPSSRRTSST